MARMNDIMQRLARGADLLGEPLPKLPIIELAGDRRVLIENHFGVTEYGVNAICVRVKFGKIHIKGSSLELAKMCRGQLVISGCIDSIQLLRGS